MKKVLFIFLALLCIQTASAQAYGRIYPNLRDVRAKVPIENAQLEVLYDFRFITKPEEGIYNRDEVALQIGDSVTRYYSIVADKIDSLGYNRPTKEFRDDRDALKIAHVWGAFEREIYPWYLDIYTTAETRTINHRFMDKDYTYSESIEPMKWEFAPERKTVLGYECQAAKTTYRGREYTAWFCPELPYNHGPWKLSGLPGLILEVSDAQEHFKWQAVGITASAKNPIYKYDVELSKSLATDVLIPQYATKRAKPSEIDRLWQIQWLSPMTLIMLKNPNAQIYGGANNTPIDINSLVIEGYYPKLEVD